MARMAAAGFWLRVRAFAQPMSRGRVPGSCAAAGVLLAGLALFAFSSPVLAAEPVKAEATFSSEGGYARLVVKFAGDVPSEVVTAGSIILIRFERPADVSVD